MTIHNLDKIFKPRRIVLIGVARAPTSLGLAVLRNLLGSGFEGVIYTVDPEREAIHGVPTYPSLASLPHVPDLALICSPAAAVPQKVRECGQAGIQGLAILSGGFRETGAAGRQLEEQIAEAAQTFAGMRILGPNSLGLIAPRYGLNASHAVTLPEPGHLAFVSESRALCNSVMGWATDQGIGFSYFVSTGSRLDVSVGDLIDYLSDDPQTRAIILYLQSIEHPRSFLSAARAFTRRKPIVVYKAGRFAESAKAAASHTGTMVVEDAVYNAAFERAGVVRVNELEDVFDVAELLASQHLPRGPRLAIISNAGGPAVIATDALLARGGKLARFSEETRIRLDDCLPPLGDHDNPVDLLDSAPPQRFGAATEIVLEDRGVDAVLVIFATQMGSDPSGVATKVIAAAQTSMKPVLAAWMGGGVDIHDGIKLLNAAGMATHNTPEQAVRAFMHLVSYGHNLEILYETPRDVPVHFSKNRSQRREQLLPLLQNHTGQLSEENAKNMLQAYGIEVPTATVAHSSAEAVEIAAAIGYPVVLKVDSAQIIHKVDVGGVIVDLLGPDAVSDAYAQLMNAAHEQGVENRVSGISVQQMLPVNRGVELILGAKKDSVFGAVIMVGMGGVTTDVMDDRALGLPPLNERLARRMLESLRCWPILQGYRGRPAVNADRLIESIIRFSCLIADFPEIREFDINPLLVMPDGIVALDAAAIFDSGAVHQDVDPYHHMAIRPYPSEHVRTLRLGDGTAVTLRPVRPEDEPMWREMMARSSPESIHNRFRGYFRRATHQMAVQYCVIDYERDIGIVAEIEATPKRELIGAAQVLTDAAHKTAEFAEFISDPWQGRGVGGLMLDYCLDLSSKWGIKRMIAETDRTNRPMLTMLRRRGFKPGVNQGNGVVYLEKVLLGTAESADNLL